MQKRLFTLVTIAALAGSTATATAAIGTGVGATPLRLARPARPGATYKLPDLYVKNTGTVTATYRVRIERISPGAEAVIPAAWIHLSRRAVRLSPGRIAAIDVRLAVPTGASSGRYLTDLVATTYARRRAGQPALGAAAADQVAFNVPSRSSFPWPPIVAAGIAALLGIGVLTRKRGRSPIQRPVAGTT